ncbi:MAG: IS1634 family transposase [Bacteroidetes bacterium]|nr:IS1634 family transposase [Bacteroidota bacterium]
MGKIEGLDTREKKKALADRIEELLRGDNPLFFVEKDSFIESLEFYQKIKQNRKIVKKAKGTDHQEESKPSGEETEKDFRSIDLNSFVSEDVREIGSEWMCLQTVRKLKLPEFLSSLGWDEKWINIALVHLISKAVFPVSELKTEQWIKQNSGIAGLLGVKYGTITRHHLYQVARMLYSVKESLEIFLAKKSDELFDIEDKIVLYDLTNTYFEGRKADSSIAQYGRSKEKRSDAKLLSLALVTNAEGFVKYSKIYPGNMADGKTLGETVDELSKVTRSDPDAKPMVVIDAGIAEEGNLKMLKDKGYDYLCVTRSKLKDYTAANTDNDPITIYDKNKNPIEIKSIKVKGQTDRFLYVRSEQKSKKESSMEQRVHTRFEQELQQVSDALSKKGGIKKIEKVWERIGRIKERYPSANKFYAITVEEKKAWLPV